MGSWADRVIEELRAGRTTTIRPRGNSMVPLIASGQRVELEPVRADDPLDVRVIVLVRVRERITCT